MTRQSKRKSDAATSGVLQVQTGRGLQAMAAARAGGRQVEAVARQYANASQANHVAGRVFEELHAATGNIDAALKGLPQRFATTASEGQPHAAADLVVKLGGETVAAAQAKLSESSTALTRRLSEAAYDNMQKLVPEGKAESVRRMSGALADAGRRPDLSLRDTSARVTERVSFKGACSKPVSVANAQKAARKPAAAAKKLEADTARGAYSSAAAMGGAMSGVMTAVQGGSAGDVVKATAKGAARGLAQQAATAGVEKVAAAALTQVSSKAAAAFSRGGAAGAIAGAGIGVAVDLADLVNGEITGSECAGRAVKHGVRAGSAWAGAEAGAALGTVIGGPIGTAVGGLLGGLVGSLVPDWF